MEPSHLPSTDVPFDWDAIPFGTQAHWDLGWELFREQWVRLEGDGIVPHARDRAEGSLWTPAVDLALDSVSTLTWFEEGSCVPERSVWSIATAGLSAAPARPGDPARLVRGTVMRLEAVREDRTLEGMGANCWSMEATSLGVRFIHSALEGRWGPKAILADSLLVPLDHPIVGEDERADRLVRDLQAITRAFRVAHGLPAEGRAG